jgi:hypothetical protein
VFEQSTPLLGSGALGERKRSKKEVNFAIIAEAIAVDGVDVL